MTGSCLVVVKPVIILLQIASGLRAVKLGSVISMEEATDLFWYCRLA